MPGKRTLTQGIAAQRIVQRAADTSETPTPSAGDIATATIEGKGSGAPVPDGVRRVAESHLGGADLRDVRVHSDGNASAGAEMIGAQAFAHGRDVFLGPGQSANDVGLMTHELTHVVQQGAAGPAVQAKVEVAPSDHPAEAEADSVAARAVAQGEVGGAIVDDGAATRPGQLTRSAVIAEITAAAQREIAAAPPAMQDQLRKDVETQTTTYRAQDTRTLERSLAAIAGGKQADARSYVAAATAKIHDHVAGAASGSGSAPPATGAEAAARMGPSQSVDGAAAKAVGDVLGAPMGDVQVHTGPAAAKLASDHGARAIAVGDHIAFASGQYQPNTPAGDALLAHEMAHVAQMRGADPSAPIERGEDHADEHEADEVAASVVEAAHSKSDKPVRRKSILSSLRTTLQLKRCPDNQPQVNPLQTQANQLKAQLPPLIAGAVWSEIRKRAYPAESAAGVVRAKQRQQGTRTDLTGLGSIARLDHFAAAIHHLKDNWPASRGARLNAIATAIDAELTAVQVPPFLIVEGVDMQWKGSFGPTEWRYNLSNALLDNPALSDADAEELCNTTAHEARHAEQSFLAARYSAGAPENLNAGEIRAQHGIPLAIAQAAVAARFTGATPGSVRALGQTMHQANVTDRAANQQISDDDYTHEMAVARGEAVTALHNLNAAVDATTVAEALQKRNTLQAAIAEVERRYTLYRNIPYEADAHEVGDAAGEAYKGWP